MSTSAADGLNIKLVCSVADLQKESHMLGIMSIRTSCSS